MTALNLTSRPDRGPLIPGKRSPCPDNTVRHRRTESEGEYRTFRACNSFRRPECRHRDGRQSFEVDIGADLRAGEPPPLNAVRAKRPQRLPVVLSRNEVRILIGELPRDPMALMVELLYGTGMRVLGCCRLRVEDLDFDRHKITVREGKGDEDRSVPLPARLAQRPLGQREYLERLHRQDLAAGLGRVWLPTALALT